MSTLEYILLFTFIGSILALVGGVVLLSQQKIMLKITHLLASFSAGVLLGTAFFDLLPEALHEGESRQVDIFLWTLAGIVVFFLLERFIHWFHHHEEYHDEKEKRATLPLIIVGDSVHNFIDGVVIAATFMINIPTGIVTALAIFTHELPQEIGDFGLMLHKGMAKKKILWVNVFSAAVAFAGAILTYLLGGFVEIYLPILLAVTAGFFIYIAASDLIPEIHHEKRNGFAFFESFLLIAGIASVYVVVNLLGHGH